MKNTANLYQVKNIRTCIKSRVLEVSVPGSKSITNRALLLAALAKGKSRLNGVLFSDDSRHFLDCVQRLGIDTAADEMTKKVMVKGQGGVIPNQNASVYVGSAGTAARFLSALLGLAKGTYHLDSSEQMRRRPMAPLLSSLKELGAVISYEGKEGYFPYTITGNPDFPSFARVNIDSSSQFLSALLIAFGASGKECAVETEGTHGMAYITMTCRMMEQFGVYVKQEGRRFVIPEGQSYHALDYDIEPDASAACYFYAMAPLLGISVTVPGVHFNGLQGDVEFLRLLERMGCRAEETEKGICVAGPQDAVFPGIDADMHSCSDQAITLAAIAPYASSPTTIRGIGHIRFQESNRIAAMIKELGRMGIFCEELEDGVRIYPGTPKPAKVCTYEDHRMAMGFSLTGLRTDGIAIKNPMCCQKTFGNYFETLDQAVNTLAGF